MATQPRLVNKQFNSPIGLYSDQNVREVLERDAQILANGAIGINFHNPNVGKPANLQNSAVLRMLEEEEHRQRNGHSASDDYVPRTLRETIKWPPPDYEAKHRQRSTFKDVLTSGVKRVAWPPPPEASENYTEQSAVTSQGGPQYTSQLPAAGLQNNQSLVQKTSLSKINPNPSFKPLNISTGGNQSPNLFQSPTSPNLNQSPIGFRPTTPNRQWAPVPSPTLGQPPIQPSFQQYQAAAPISPQRYQPSVAPQPFQTTPTQQYQSQPALLQYQTPQKYPQLSSQSVAVAPSQVEPKVAAARTSEPPPSIITLRPQAPVSQAPPPVVTSQPATATLKGGKNLRGDLKWPPENVKSQIEEENRQRIELARGPAFRPRKVKKDYTNFFAQHALNSSYPGYKVPPGTQYYKNQ